MKTAEAFFDTNIVLYLLSEDARKADRAEAVIAAGGAVSVQVLNEFASVASRKLKMGYAEIRDVLDTVRTVCVVRPLSVETHDLGLEIAERFGYSLYDSLIIAAALQAECTVLYSEDMQDGQLIDGRLLIVNPFLKK